MKRPRHSHSAALKAVPQLREKLQRALALHNAGRLVQAQSAYKEILAIQPEHFDALHLLGMIAAQTGDPKRAVELIGKAIEIDPTHPAPYNTRGLTLIALRQWDAALASLDRAVALKADYAEAFFNRGIVFYQLKQWDAALTSLDQAIAIKSGYAEACNNRGLVLSQLKRFDAALTSFDQAIAIKSGYPEAHNNRGLVLSRLKRFDAALTSFDQAIAFKADYAEAHANRGIVLRELKQWEAALASYERALALKPDYAWLHGSWLDTKMHLCDWKDLEVQVARLAFKIERAEKAALPFVLLELVDSAEAQRRAAEAYVEDTYPASLALPSVGPRPHGAKIRVAYVSADFGEHAVSHLLVGALEHFQRERFELIGVSLRESQDNSELGHRIRRAFDQFIEVGSQSDAEVATQLRALQVDIAVDLMGFTQGMRMGIFAYRAAPVQVGYLGYAGTTGARYIDYLIADATAIPEGKEGDYTEQIVRLPHCCLPYDDRHEIASPTPSRAEAGLPAEGVVLCAFTGTYKLNPTMFGVWMRLLRAVPGSVLWLRATTPDAASNLRREAQQRGVDATRLIFAPRLAGMSEHLARHSLADLYLDTLPYNAHSTACDALWAGVPVLTCVGHSLASRLAASAVLAAGLPDLITHSLEEYEQRALELAQDAAALRALRMRLTQSRRTAALFDTASYTRHLEAAFQKMHERCLHGLAPDSFHVPIDEPFPDLTSRR